MTCILDSNIISYILKEDQAVKKRFYAETKAGCDFVMAPCVYYEVQRGLLAKRMDKKLAVFDKLCRDMGVGRFDTQVWRKSAQIHADLTRRGKIIPDGDIFLASFCILNDYLLVTHDKNHFERIDGLEFVDWKE